MATIREYYETDFNNAIRLHIKIPFEGNEIESCILYDFTAYCSYVACYFSGEELSLQFYTDFLKKFQYNRQVIFDNNVTLPSIKSYHGELKFDNTGQLKILSKFFGEEEWKSTQDLKSNGRIYFYSIIQLGNRDLIELYKIAKTLNIDLQFRSVKYEKMRSSQEKPLGFICHDSRDKTEVAYPIALGLGKLQCPVWYDEFSLKVGDSLRTSIEKGLKECKKCILILSPNFFSNNGWTKAEFDSIFTRQILEEQSLILPVWYNVSKQEVYDYSPSLLNIKGLDWKTLGADEVCRQLYRVIDP